MLYLWIVLQILLESLPVSSSGHVALMQKYVYSFKDLPLSQEQLWIIDFLLHGPMVVILILFFFKTWWQMILQHPCSLKTLKQIFSLRSSYVRDFCWKQIFTVTIFGCIADGITVFFWWLDMLPAMSLTAGFVITAILLYMTRYAKEKVHTFDMNYGYAMLLGIGQSFSFVPGVSRFATTYAVGRFCGYSGRISLAVSFLIQLPLLIAACIKGCIALQKYPELVRNFFDFKVLFVILAASVMSYLLLWCVDRIVKKNRLWLFAWYILVPIVLTLFV